MTDERPARSERTRESSPAAETRRTGTWNGSHRLTEREVVPGLASGHGVGIPPLTDSVSPIT